jgi:peptidyl-Asp metalloendopeptidase
MSKLRTLSICSAFLILQLILQLGPAWSAPNRRAETPRLYAIEKSAQPNVSRELVPDGIEEFRIEVAPAAVAANPPVFLVDLPDFRPLEAVRTRFVTYRPDWKSWFGTLQYAAGGQEAGFIHIGYHGDQITGLIEFEGERYRIVVGPDKNHRLVRLSGELSPPPCGLEDKAGLIEIPRRLDPPGDGPAPAAKAASVAGAFKVATRIDVLAVYPRAFFANSWTESSLFTFVQDSISIANNAFANSNVNAFYNLVGVVPVLDSQPTTGVFSSLNWLNGETPELVALRNAFGADVVTVYIPFEWSSPNVCGVANLPQTGGGFIPGSGAFGQKAYTANRNGCGLNDFTLGHEIGHNYGMRHEDDTNDASDLFGYGRGHLLTVSGQQKATVMGCTCGLPPKAPCGSNISNAVCNRILYFSDPNISYLGVPTGVPPSGGDPGRNNALVARNQVAAYAGFRPQGVNTPPTANFSVVCCNLRCAFNAGSSTDNLPLPATAANYRWDFRDGTTGTGKTVIHDYASAGAYMVHLVVYDSGGQSDVFWKIALPQNNNCNPGPL